MSSIKLISILIPAYNVERYIENCLESILCQINNNVEVIIVNDCSTDNTNIVIEKIISQNKNLDIKLILNPRNLGLGNSRRIALENARGKYIFNIDGDDSIENGVLLPLLELIKHHEYDLVYFNYFLVWKQNKRKGGVNIFNNPKEYLNSTLTAKSESSVCNKLIKRSMYVENEIFPFQNLNYGEDFGVTARLLYFAKEIYFFPVVCYNYNQANDNSYTKNGSLRAIHDLEKIFHNLKDFFHSRGETILMDKLNIGITRKILQLFYSFDFVFIKDLRRVLIENTDPVDKGHFSSIDRVLILALKNENYMLLLVIKKIHIFKVKLINVIRKYK